MNVDPHETEPFFTLTATRAPEAIVEVVMEWNRGMLKHQLPWRANCKTVRRSPKLPAAVQVAMADNKGGWRDLSLGQIDAQTAKAALHTLLHIVSGQAIPPFTLK